MVSFRARRERAHWCCLGCFEVRLLLAWRDIVSEERAGTALSNDLMLALQMRALNPMTTPARSYASGEIQGPDYRSAIMACCAHQAAAPSALMPCSTHQAAAPSSLIQSYCNNGPPDTHPISGHLVPESAIPLTCPPAARMTKRTLPQYTREIPPALGRGLKRKLFHRPRRGGGPRDRRRCAAGPL